MEEEEKSKSLAKLKNKHEAMITDLEGEGDARGSPAHSSLASRLLPCDIKVPEPGCSVAVACRVGSKDAHCLIGPHPQGARQTARGHRWARVMGLQSEASFLTL